MSTLQRLSALLVSLLVADSCAANEQLGTVSELKITILSTMLTEFQGVGEWGFAALVEADGHSVLFDTGGRPDTVLKNAEELGLDLSTVETVVISHNHWDHTGGLVTLRKALKHQNDAAMQQTHVGKGIFLLRRIDEELMGSLPPMPKEFVVSVLEVREAYLAEGGHFTVHAEPHELHPGVWVTGPIPRVHRERNWTPFMCIDQEGSLIEDTIPEDQALVINTTNGLVVLSGCGHAGIVNTMEHARSITSVGGIHAVLGGFHLMTATQEHLDWTGKMMNEFGVQYVVGAHCTGINPVARLREAGKFDRTTAVVGAVGTTFSLEAGLNRGLLNR
jgi:7,8-dihydropterin-6-yl-methyl-4-(beta-D-ribofuranosyl)aminobenzene 5'-phosphate synthase